MQGESNVEVKHNSKSKSPWTASRGLGSAVDKFPEFPGSMNLISALAQISSLELKTITANQRHLARSVINRTKEMAQALDCFCPQVLTCSEALPRILLNS